MSKEKFTAANLIDRLRKRFGKAQEYTVLEQVADGTGRYTSSWIDAVVLSLWPSNGLWRAAFEVKVSRSDFLREVTDPEKNAWTRKYHHQFWFIAPSDCIKDAQELPEGAGWMKPHGDGLAIVRAATNRADPTTDDQYIAALARSLKKEDHWQEREWRERWEKNDPDHLSAMACMEACKRFLSEKGASWYGSTDGAESLYKALSEVTADRQAEEEREQVRRELDNFQSTMTGMLEVFLGLAHVGLLERDALGKLIPGYARPDVGLVRHESQWSRDQAEKAARRVRLILGASKGAAC